MSAAVAGPGQRQEVEATTAIGPRGGAAAFVVRVIRERPSAAAGAIVLLLALLMAAFAPQLAPYGVNEQVGPVYGPPSLSHPFGLDDGGIDVLSLIIYGGRVSLTVGFTATFVAMIVGGSIGILSGYLGGATDGILMRITDYFLTVPVVPLMIVIAVLWGPSLSHIVLVIGLLQWTMTARIVRSQVRSIRERVYVKRVRALGGGHARSIFRHVLPQVAPLLVATTVLTVATAIFAETSLAFLGLSDPSRVSWGTMIQHAFSRTAMSSGAWWAIVYPGLAVAVVVMACYLLGQAIEDAMNPRLKVSHISVRPFRMRSLTRGEP